ncbi:peptidyl-prolyl cis-trans isomerase [Gemmobacter caeruleus]|uniref:peptidyl-prolyl cis-trans isomerase n=1 Tax=Gemmobacter caeruleus TaxID=2595004 RepID=UPI0011ED3FAE|nr:peptidyl-prolyl cis-trans isomerase [Gemmobacter caeruleus]
MTKDTDSDSPKRKRKGGSVLSFVLLAMVVGGLGGYGVTNYGTGGLNIGTVGDREIDANRYARALQSQIAETGQQLGTQLDLAQAQQLGLDAQVRQNLVTTYALDDEAAKIGLSVGDAAVGQEIRAMNAFKGVSGEFDQFTYEETLKRNNMTVREYEAGVRDDIARSLLTGAVASGFAAPAVLTDTIHSYIAERRALSVLTLTEASLTAPLPQPDEAALKAFYEAHLADFTRPEAKRITYAALLPEDLAATMPVDEAELKALYDSRADEFLKPERRLVERLVFGSEEEATAAKARIDAGESFDKIVEERGLKLLDIDLGDVTQAELGAAGEAVFALAEPGTVGPLPSDLGPALFRMNAVLAAQETSFEDAKADLTTEYQMDAARRAIGDKLEAVDDLLAGGATLEDLAKEQGMELATIDFSAKSDDKIAGYPAFREAAGKVQDGDFPEAVQLDDGGLVALRLDEIVPATPIPFDEARAAVTEAWHKDALQQALLARADAIKAEIEQGANLGRFGIVDVSPEIAREGRIEGTPDSLVPDAFKMAKGAVARVEGPGYVGLVQVDDILPASEAGDDAEALKSAIAAQVEQGMAQDAYAMFANTLAQSAGITFNQAAIEAVHASLR